MGKTTNKKISLVQKIKEGLPYHITDSTAFLILSSPTFAAIETQFFRMSHDNSVNSRLLAAGLTYAGIGGLFSKGMHSSRNFFDIKPESKERIKQIHDTGYSLICSLTTPLFYYTAGVRDTEQIVLGTGVTLALATALGGPVGYFVDAFRDLTGLEDSERIPKTIQQKSPAVKKGLAALLTTAAAGLTFAMYKI